MIWKYITIEGYRIKFRHGYASIDDKDLFNATYEKFPGLIPFGMHCPYLFSNNAAKVKYDDKIYRLPEVTSWTKLSEELALQEICRRI